MQLGACKRMHAPLAAARAWPLWELPRWLTGYIVAIVVAYLAVLSVVGQFYTLSPRQIVILGALILCGAATVELTKRSGENAGLISDIYGVWELPIAILLPLGYAMLVPVIRLTLTQRRVRHIPLHRRVFTAAIIGLSYAAGGALFHALSHTGFGSVPSPSGPSDRMDPGYSRRRPDAVVREHRTAPAGHQGFRPRCPDARPGADPGEHP